jgi:signal transduction histidine kinase
VIGLTAAVEAGLAIRYGTAPPFESVSSICWIVIWGICGLVAWRHRPVSRIGPLMVLMAALIAITALRAFEIPPAFPLQGLITAIGFFGFNLQLALSSHMFLTYPSGRPADPFTRRFIVAGYVLAIVGGIGRLSVYHTYVIDCADRCGLNMLGFWIALPVAEFLSSTTDICFAVLGFLLLVMLVRPLRGATARERRTLWLPLGSAAGAVLLVAVAFAGNAVHEDFAPPAVLFAATVLAVTAVPVAFLWGLLQDRLAFAGVGDLVGELGRVGPDQIQPKLARVLADPGLMVLFPVDGGLVDVDGNRVDAPLPDAGRALTRLGDGPAPLALLLHDRALLEHPELLDAAGAAARLALENARLQAEVRAQLAEVRASRARLVDVADTERRRLERDLHDGAQQRLLGMGMTLQTLRGRLPGDDSGTDRLIEEATAELRSALRELRDVAQGIHPAVLTDQGLTAALGMLARRCPLPVRIQGDLPDRPPAAVEAAAYYLASEALQNAVKHANATGTTIQVHRDGDTLVLDVIDDGVGGAQLDAGTGLRGLHDRVTAINGTLTVHSPSGGGTHLCARLPWN